jgi:hypothetical protein
MGENAVKILYDSKLPLPRNEDFYINALQVIEQDGVFSQIYYLLKQRGRLEETPSFFQNQLKEQYDKDLFQNLFIKNQTEHILRVFEDNGIDVIPLKGVYFAEKFFGHIGARATSDIDLLLKYYDLEKAIHVIQSLGFTVEEEQIPGHFHCSFSKPLPFSEVPLVVELHWSLVKNNTSKFDVNDLWEKAKPIGQFEHVYELSNNHTFYMICLHGWRHNLDSMKYFLDIIQLIEKKGEELDFEQIFVLAESHQTFKRMHRTLSIVYQEFPYLEQIKSFPLRKKKTYWEYRETKGLKRYYDFIEYQFFSYDSIKHSFVEISNWLWPSMYELSSQLDSNPKSSTFFSMLLSLYRKRITGVFNTLMSHK